MAKRPQIGLSLEQSALDRTRAIAQAQHRSLCSIIGQALDEWLNKYAPVPAAKPKRKAK